MSDKNQPKEIFICGNKLDNIYLLEKMSIYDIKYISSTHHNEIVEGLKAEIKQSNQENSHNKHTMEWYRHEITELKAEIESLKSKAESKRKHWNTK